MKTPHAILVAAFVLLTPLVVAQLKFPDDTVQTTAAQVYVTTIVVSPTGTAIQNGTALVAAYSALTGASAGAPFLLKLEPGIYDLGTGRLNLIPYANLEGSGAESTIIQSSQNSAENGILDFEGSLNTDLVEVRNLTVEHTGTNKALGIYNDSTLLMDNVNVTFSGVLTDSHYIVRNNGGYLRLRDCELSSYVYAIPVTDKEVFGLFNEGSGNCEVFGSTIRIRGTGALGAAGVHSLSGNVILRHCVISAEDSTRATAYAYGILGFHSGVPFEAIYAGACELYGTDGFGAHAQAGDIVGANCWTAGFDTIADF